MMWVPSALISLLAGFYASLATVLDRLGVISRDRLTSTVELAWPRVITGFAIMSKQTADIAMVGWVLGPTAVAGLAFANAYWMVGKFISIGLAGGTVALVSQNYGGGESERASVVVKQSLWVAVMLAVPLVLAFWFFPTQLIGLIGGDSDAIAFGALYLALVAPALFFEFLNMIASRTYAGVGDTFTPMVIRAGGAVLNIVLSAVLIFGYGMGVAGAAIGTTVSIAAIFVVLFWGMTGRSYFGRGASPVPVTLSGPQFDRQLTAQLLKISTPLMARRAAEGVVLFPLLAIAAVFGPVVVAAVEVGRRVRDLVNSFSWGFSIASSTLVGQQLGAGDEVDAAAYGREIIQLSFVVYLVVAAVVFLLAEPISRIFVDDPAHVTQTTIFVQIAAVSVIALGVDGSATGALRGAGDTTVPFVATLVGLYLIALPIAATGTVTQLGVAALYIAFLAETAVPMVINLWRFNSDRWKEVSRSYRPAVDD